MLPATLQTLLLRELRAVRREIEAYPDDASVWRSIPGVPNTGGTLALHLAGNMQHYIGAVLGRTGYKRDRDAEFSRRDVSRREIVATIDKAIASVERTMPAVTKEVLAATYPELIANRKLPTALFMAHLASHLAYHLGQLDYHRRAVTGDSRAVDAISVRELPEVV